MHAGGMTPTTERGSPALDAAACEALRIAGCIDERCAVVLQRIERCAHRAEGMAGFWSAAFGRAIWKVEMSTA